MYMNTVGTSCGASLTARFVSVCHFSVEHYGMGWLITTHNPLAVRANLGQWSRVRSIDRHKIHTTRSERFQPWGRPSENGVLDMARQRKFRNA